MVIIIKSNYICQTNARVAQLVERQPSKLNVAGSNPVSRSICKKGFSEKKTLFYNCFFIKKIVVYKNIKLVYLPTNARVAQLVERQPSKLNVAGSNPVSRSICKKGFSEKKILFFMHFFVCI